MRRILYTTAHALEETDDGYDLGRSTSNNLSFGEILDDTLVSELRRMSAGYGTTAGIAPLRAAIAGLLALSPEQVLTTHGAIAALHLAVFCLCDQGDEVVTVTPGFPATFDIIQSLGAVKRSLALRFDDGYALDVERLGALLSERTQLVLLISPHNPSGVITDLEVVASVLDRMRERAPHAYLLVDETFRQAAYGTRPPAPSAARLSERVLTVSSLSKAHGAPGLRLGWITCTEPELLAHLKVGKGKTAISSSILDERLGAHILANAGKILSDRNARLDSALSLVEKWMTRNSEHLEWVRPHAGGLCCVRLRRSVFDDARVETFYEQAARRRINLAAGNLFLDERRVFRLGFGALPITSLEPALEALEDTCRNAAKRRATAR